MADHRHWVAKLDSSSWGLYQKLDPRGTVQVELGPTPPNCKVVVKSESEIVTVWIYCTHSTQSGAFVTVWIYCTHSTLSGAFVTVWIYCTHSTQSGASFKFIHLHLIIYNLTLSYHNVLPKSQKYPVFVSCILSMHKLCIHCTQWVFTFKLQSWYTYVCYSFYHSSTFLGTVLIIMKKPLRVFATYSYKIQEKILVQCILFGLLTMLEICGLWQNVITLTNTGLMFRTDA